MWTAFVPRTALRMQTVITWRRPMDASLYAPTGNPCTYLLGNALCYIISGMMLLVVGVIITSLTFQNLEAYKDENKERYAGPVLIGAGVLVLARGAFSKLRPQRSHLQRRRSFLRRYVREMYSRPILAFRNSASFSLCDLQVSDIQDSNSRTRLYSDEPPPYDLVTSDHYLSGHLHGPAHNTDPESPHSHNPHLPQQQHHHHQHHPQHNQNHHHHHHQQQHHHLRHSSSSSSSGDAGPRGYYNNNDSVNDDEVFNGSYSDDYLQPPPHYEDFIRECESIRTTRL